MRDGQIFHIRLLQGIVGRRDARVEALPREDVAAHFCAETGVGRPTEVRQERSHGEIDVSVLLLAAKFGITLGIIMAVVRGVCGGCMHG